MPFKKNTTNNGCVGFVHGGIIKAGRIVTASVAQEDPENYFDDLVKLYGNEISFRYAKVADPDTQTRNFAKALESCQCNDNIYTSNTKSADEILRKTLEIKSLSSFSKKKQNKNIATDDEDTKVTKDDTIKPKKIKSKKVEPEKVEPEKVEPEKVKSNKIEPEKVKSNKIEPEKVVDKKQNVLMSEKAEKKPAAKKVVKPPPPKEESSSDENKSDSDGSKSDSD